MENTSPLELMLQERMKVMWPGMPEQDNRSMARAMAVLGLYSLGPDSLPKEGVPKGQLMDGSMVSSIYPGSTHVYKVYVPAQYDPQTPTPYMVFLDGISQYLTSQVNANVVLDNLIAEKRIPVMLAIFVEPGDKGNIVIYMMDEDGTTNKLLLEVKSKQTVMRALPSADGSLLYYTLRGSKCRAAELKF